jgi:hypothetical protein
VRRDSSITTGVSVVSLNAELVRRVVWWLHPRFADTNVLEAAELVAFDVFEPTMRSRGAVGKAASALAQDDATRREFRALFEGPPTGRLDLPALPEVVDRLEELETRLAEIEKRLTRVLKIPSVCGAVTGAVPPESIHGAPDRRCVR